MRPLLLLFVAVSVFAADDTKLRIHELGKPGADKLADLPARYATFMSQGYGASMPNPVFRLSDLAFLPEGRRERLDLYVSYRRDFKVRRPGVLFIHGGGFTGGDKAEYRTASVSADLARAGYVVVSCNYVLGPKDKAGVWPRNIADCRDAVRWMRANADALGLDPDRIAVAGGSAGGHLAASVATLPGLDDAKDDKSVSCLPNALVLYNPGTVMAPFPGLDLKGFGAGLDKSKFGCEPTEISPLHHVKKGTPPTIIFHGKADTTVPYSTVEKFTEVMKAAGNRCELVGYEGQPHGFFNKAKYAETLAATDAFLVSLGYLPAKK